MPKRISRPKRPTDPNEWARQMVDESTAESKAPEPLPAQPEPTREQISAVMAALGRRGGRIGGKRKLETMTKKQRSALASKAAKARWKKQESDL